jgi:hypothetical protein
MESATENRHGDALSFFLAGLQAGLIGLFWMLAWMGVSDVLHRRGFWTAENLLASIFRGDAAIRSGFAASTVSGLALYLVLYTLLGALFAMAVREHLTRVPRMLAGILWGVCWYYFSFRVLWNAVAPLVWLLHAERPTLLAHVVYGALVSRFPAYRPGGKRETAALPAVEGSAEADSAPNH